jgi:hypothetical protein
MGVPGDYPGQVTLRGYDNMTGIGPPRGQLFIRALRKLAVQLEPAAQPHCSQCS